MKLTNNDDLIIKSSLIIDKYKDLLLGSSIYQEEALRSCRRVVRLTIDANDDLPLQLLTSRDRLLQYYAGFSLPYMRRKNWYNYIKPWLKHEDKLLTFIALDNLASESEYPDMRKQIVSDEKSLSQIISLIEDSNGSRIRELAAKLLLNICKDKEHLPILIVGAELIALKLLTSRCAFLQQQGVEFLNLMTKETSFCNSLTGTSVVSKLLEVIVVKPSLEEIGINILATLFKNNNELIKSEYSLKMLILIFINQIKNYPSEYDIITLRNRITTYAEVPPGLTLLPELPELPRVPGLPELTALPRVLNENIIYILSLHIKEVELSTMDVLMIYIINLTVNPHISSSLFYKSLDVLENVPVYKSYFSLLLTKLLVVYEQPKCALNELFVKRMLIVISILEYPVFVSTKFQNISNVPLMLQLQMLNVVAFCQELELTHINNRILTDIKNNIGIYPQLILNNLALLSQSASNCTDLFERGFTETLLKHMDSCIKKRTLIAYKDLILILENFIRNKMIRTQWINNKKISSKLFTFIRICKPMGALFTSGMNVVFSLSVEFS